MTDVSIRAPRENEIAFLAALGRRFHAASPYAHLEYDLESMLGTLWKMYEQQLFLVAERENRIIGAVGALKGGMFFNAHLLVGIERFWWVDPENRDLKAGLGLLAGIERAAIAADCVELIMFSLEGGHERAGAIYQQFGFTPIERAWSKRLTLRGG